MRLKNLLDVFLDILYPPICVVCETHLNESEKVKRACDKCLNSVPINNALFCPKCRGRLAENKKICHQESRYLLAAATTYSNEMVQKLNKYEGNYQKVVITDRYDQPYILVLFFKQYDPAKYQPQAKLSLRDQFNFGTVRAFDKYEFREPAINELTNKDTLFIMSGEKAPKNVKILDIVDFPNGKPAFVFIGEAK